MRIREGDPLEIYTDSDGEVIFKKYSPIGELTSFASTYAETLFKTCGYAVAITDRDAVTASAGIPKREFGDKKISQALVDIIEKRQLYVAGDISSRVMLIGDDDKYYGRVIMPIISEGDVVGSISLLSPVGEYKTADALEIKTLQTAAAFLAKQLE